ncbi:hypothetical protein NX059_002068 [Plenodomus lindquistii]|nr:hypothetical protein NX059_002068 [Plenodomus lindquistii]
MTLRTSGVLVPNGPFGGSIDCLALGAFGAGLVCKDAVNGTQKAISLGNYRIHRARQDGDDALDLRERPDASFMTVPAQNSGEEIVITHYLSAKRLFAFAAGFGAQDVRIGEEYVLRLRDDYVGTGWWCWGDLDVDLKGKRLHAYSEGSSLGVEKPSDEDIEKGGWVLGENSTHVKFEMGEDAATCILTIVE